MYPLVYCASKLHRAAFWRDFARANEHRLGVVSSWHNSHTVEEDEANAAAATFGWIKNLVDLRHATALIAWVEADEKPNGTLTEIGAMLSRHKPIYLVGTFEWGTWRHLPFVSSHPTVDHAVDQLLKDVA